MMLFSPKPYHIYQTTLQCLSSYGCAVTMCYASIILNHYHIACTHSVRVCTYLNIGHNDEVHSCSLSVLSSAAVQGLRNWDYPFVSDFTQDVVLFINLFQR